MLTTCQADVLSHLGYEWWMFRSMLQLLGGLARKGDPVRNAMVESLLMHGRALISFFHDGRNKPSDWLVEDLNHGLTSTTTPPELQNWRNAANQRVAHLTTVRAIPLNDIDTGTVLTFISERIDEVRQCLGTDFPQNWLGDSPIVTDLLGLTVHTGLTGSTQPSVSPSSLGLTGPARP